MTLIFIDDSAPIETKQSPESESASVQFVRIVQILVLLKFLSLVFNHTMMEVCTTHPSFWSLETLPTRDQGVRIDNL